MPTRKRRVTKKEAEPKFKKRLRKPLKKKTTKLTNKPGLSSPRLKKLKLNG